MVKLSYDMHIHSCLSPCGDDEMTPENIAGMASIIGYDVIALTDHNTCRNCPALISAAKKYGITAICGMELTTSEEVHVLCYFPTLEDALRFDEYVYPRILDVENVPAIFGNQRQYGENDEMCCTEPKLLISATSIDFDDVFDLLKEFNGVMVPAHINKSSTSVLSNLGFIPPDSKFTCFEIKNLDDLTELQQKYSYLQNCNVLSSSDAHFFDAFRDATNFIHPEENTVSSILEHIGKFHR